MNCELCGNDAGQFPGRWERVPTPGRTGEARYNVKACDDCSAAIYLYPTLLNERYWPEDDPDEDDDEDEYDDYA